MFCIDVVCILVLRTVKTFFETIRKFDYGLGY